METTNVIIVTEDTATGAATIEVLPMQAETSSDVVTQIIEAILDPLGDETETTTVEPENTTVMYQTVDSSSVEDATAETYSEATYDSTITSDVTADVTTTQTFDAATTAGYADTTVVEDYVAATPAWSAESTVTTDSTVETTPEVNTADVEAQATTAAHASVATEAQAQADAAVARGDYEAAAYHREVAEDAAWEAGDNSLLHGSNSTQLTTADSQQDMANYYEQQQAQAAQSGDYEAAREAADWAAYNHSGADYYAGGSDHSGQARMEEYQMEQAVTAEHDANWYADQSAYSAQQGNFDAAETYAAQAVEHQDLADYHADLGTHGGSDALHDTTSDVTPDASYSSYDYSSSYSSAYDSASSSYDSSSSYSE